MRSHEVRHHIGAESLSGSLLPLIRQGSPELQACAASTDGRARTNGGAG